MRVFALQCNAERSPRCCCEHTCVYLVSVGRVSSDTGGRAKPASSRVTLLHPVRFVVGLTDTPNSRLKPSVRGVLQSGWGRDLSCWTGYRKSCLKQKSKPPHRWDSCDSAHFSHRHQIQNSAYSKELVLPPWFGLVREGLAGRAAKHSLLQAREWLSRSCTGYVPLKPHEVPSWSNWTGWPWAAFAFQAGT